MNDHSGQPLHKDRELFGSPPASIGPVLSADSNVTKSDLRPGKAGRLASYTVAAVLGAAVPFGVMAYCIGWQDMLQLRSYGWFSGGSFALAAMAAIAIARGMLEPGLCSYIGEEGVAVYKMPGSRDEGVEEEKVFLFRDADRLYVSERSIHRNGRYIHTNYHYAWYGGSQKAFAITGTHSQAGTSEQFASAGSRYNLALAAELVWSKRLFEQAIATLRAGRLVAFPLKEVVLFVGADGITITAGSESESWSRDRIASVSVSGGFVTITGDGFKPLSKWDAFLMKREEGRLRVPYGEFPNARVFLALFEALRK